MSDYERHDAWKDSYDSWKLASPDDYNSNIDEPCYHEHYSANVEGIATCDECGERWMLTADEIELERINTAVYDEMMRREERRQFWRKLTYPIRWPVFRLLEAIWPRKASRVLYDDDEIPF